MTGSPNDIELHRIRGPIDAVARVPGSKSLANRALLIAALADGRSEITNVPDALDVRYMIESLRLLGVPIQTDGPRARVSGAGGAWRSDDLSLDVGDAGTVLRFLAAAVCVGVGEYRLDGGAQIQNRPIGGLVDALRSLGPRISYEKAAGHCPIHIETSGLRGGHVAFDSPDSSQFVSALLMAAPLARGDIFIEVTAPIHSRPFLDMTIRTMSEFGVQVLAEGDRFIVAAPQCYQGSTVAVEPDATSASYFFALAALAGGRATVEGLGPKTVQGDARIADLLGRMGCTIQQTAEQTTVAAPPGAALRGLDCELSDAPDLAPTLAVLAIFAGGPTRMRGVPHLRLKESDRLHSIAHNVQRLGGDIEIHDDGLTILPARLPVAAAIDTFEDHRIAMAFSLASARLDGVFIRGADCVAKSFPGFFAELRRVADTSV